MYYVRGFGYTRWVVFGGWVMGPWRRAGVEVE